MEEKKFTISEAAFEFTIEKMQQTIRRQLIAIIILCVMFIAVVGGMVYAFFWYESQFETEYYNVSSEGGGDAFYSSIGKDGDIYYGESES